MLAGAGDGTRPRCTTAVSDGRCASPESCACACSGAGYAYVGARCSSVRAGYACAGRTMSNAGSPGSRVCAGGSGNCPAAGVRGEAGSAGTAGRGSAQEVRREGGAWSGDAEYGPCCARKLYCGICSGANESGGSAYDAALIVLIVLCARYSSPPPPPKVGGGISSGRVWSFCTMSRKAASISASRARALRARRQRRRTARRTSARRTPTAASAPMKAGLWMRLLLPPLFTAPTEVEPAPAAESAADEPGLLVAARVDAPELALVGACFVSVPVPAVTLGAARTAGVVVLPSAAAAVVFAAAAVVVAAAFAAVVLETPAAFAGALVDAAAAALVPAAVGEDLLLSDTAAAALPCAAPFPAGTPPPAAASSPTAALFPTGAVALVPTGDAAVLVPFVGGSRLCVCAGAVVATPANGVEVVRAVVALVRAVVADAFDSVVDFVVVVATGGGAAVEEGAVGGAAEAVATADDGDAELDGIATSAALAGADFAGADAAWLADGFADGFAASGDLALTVAALEDVALTARTALAEAAALAAGIEDMNRG